MNRKKTEFKNKVRISFTIDGNNPDFVSIKKNESKINLSIKLGQL